MSLDRQEIADILSTIDGVHGSAYMPDQTNEGDAWPKVELLEATGPANALEVTWNIFILLPADEKSAGTWFADMYQVVADAFEGYANVQRIEPAAVFTEVGPRDCMFLTITREA